MQCVLFSRQTILDALSEFKDRCETKMLNGLKRNSERKVFINSFYLMPQVLFSFGVAR